MTLATYQPTSVLVEQLYPVIAVSVTIGRAVRMPVSVSMVVIVPRGTAPYRRDVERTTKQVLLP